MNLSSLSAVLDVVLHTTKGAPTTAAPTLSKHLVLEIKECTMYCDDLVQVEVRVHLTSINLVDITIDLQVRVETVFGMPRIRMVVEIDAIV